MKIRARSLMLPGAFVPDQTVTIEQGRIASVGPWQEDADHTVDYLTPGLIDLHCHGGEGFNARDFGIDKIRPFLDRMLRAGVTDFLMTISTGRRETMRHGLEVTRQAMRMQAEGQLGGARVLGAHLEGPFLSLSSPGAMQKSAIIPPSIEAFLDFFGGYEDVIREVSLAPEEPGADALIAHLLHRGIQVQAGHTYATYDEALRGFACGVGSLCHSFNACRPIHHREPGIVAAAMENPEIYMEAICDLKHLHPATIRLIYRMKGPDRMMLISDSTVTHGLPDGEYFAEGYDILVKDGVSRTRNGALDGGGAYLDEAVQNVSANGIPLLDAFTMASQTCARRMRLNALGEIRPGFTAHLTGWNADLRPMLAVLGDEAIPLG